MNPKTVSSASTPVHQVDQSDRMMFKALNSGLCVCPKYLETGEVRKFCRSAVIPERTQYIFVPKAIVIF